MKIALALSGGGARALAHIGVLEILEKNNIKIDCITGTSMGAIIGALYAINTSCKNVEKILKDYIFNVMFSKMNIKKMQDDSKVSSTRNFIRRAKEAVKYGSQEDNSFISNSMFKEMIDTILPNINIEDTKIPFACVATDITNGTEKVFTKGTIRTRVLASASLPGIFPPVNIDNIYYTDGAFVNVTPVTATKIFKPDFVIASDVIGELKILEAIPTNSKSIINRCNSISNHLLYKELTKDVDMLINPNVKQTSWTEFNKFDLMVYEGKKATKNKITELNQKLNNI